MSLKKIIIEPHYFPCIEYFQAISQAEALFLEVSQHFEKQNYCNRCYILSANGPLGLSIPLHKSSKLPYKEIKIDYSQKWLQKHKTAIKSAYGKSPFFEHYDVELMEILEKKNKYLVDLNFEILSKCLEILGLAVKMEFTNDYEKLYGNDVTDLRSAIHPKRPSLSNLEFPEIYYTQVFGNKFVKNLSIIDMIFCEGPNAGYLIGSQSD